jgi:predicted phage terminase large subunit-like protein
MTSRSASSATPPPSPSLSSSYDALRAATPATFAWTASSGGWHPYEHLLLLDAKLCDVAAGRCPRLIVSMPPRHGKSELISKYFPAWFLGTYPDRRVILSSYEAGYAATWGRKARDLLEEWGPALFGVQVDQKSSAADRWDLKGHAGGMNTAGAGGAITGKGASVAIIDDPIKNAEDALSETIREKIWDWYRSTLRTRLQGAPRAIILVMTRWHEDDLAARLIAAEQEGGEHWEVLELPALADPTAAKPDPLGRAPGAALCPELFDAAELDATARTLGSFWWTALYQQRPSPAEGGLLKRGWFKRYRLPDDAAARAAFLDSCDEVLQSWDMAFKETKGSDFVVGQVWGRRGADCYLLAQVRGRLGFPATVEAVRALSRAWPQALTKLVEDKANGPAVIDTLTHELAGLVAVNPEGGKVARAAAISGGVEAGNVYLPDEPWVDDFLTECAAFPNGAHDDQVDAMTQALLRLLIVGNVGYMPSIWS